MKFFIQLIKLGLAVSLVFPAVYFRTPWLASLRGESFALVLLLSLGLIMGEVVGWRKLSTRKQVILSGLILAIASFNFSLAVTTEVKFQLTKQVVLNQSSHHLETLCQHFIVGHRNF